MAKLIYTMSPWEWVCSECGESYSRVRAKKVWGGMKASINEVEKPENKDKFIGGYCEKCGCYWDSWKVDETPEKLKKCEDVKCPENRKGYCNIGGKPIYLAITKDNEVKIIKNNS